MIRDLLKWVAPGLVTVLGGTTAALSMATPSVVGDIVREGQVALGSSQSDWASISIDGRELTLSGTVDTDAKVDIARASLVSISGVRNVVDDVTVAPLASPYLFEVLVEDGKITLSGSAPNVATASQLAERTNTQPGVLNIRSGQPDVGLWRSGVDFALDQASLVETGRIQLSGLTLAVAARAKTQSAFGGLQQAFKAPPAGVAIANVSIEPMRASPYTWSARFDGKQVLISGHVPDEDVIERYRVARLSDIPVATGLSLASGAPEGFAEQSTLLLQQLSRLEVGEASIVDGVSRLSGTPATVEVAQAVTETLSGTNSIVELKPPAIGDYWMSITRQEGGTLVFDGFAPDEQTRAAFAEADGADTSYLKLGSGAPSGYRAAADFGLNLLELVSEGRVALNGSALSVSGTARTSADFEALRSRLAADLPAGITLARAEFVPPRAARYNFAIRRQADGNVSLKGMLPSPELEQKLLGEAGASSSSDVSYASGEPLNFAASVEQALSFVPWLERGEIAFNGSDWTITGTPASTIDQGAIQTEFAVEGLAQSGWSLDLTSPAEPPAVVSPYLWSAERLPDGSFLFAGNVPAKSLQDYLAVHVETRVTDTSKVSPGAPAGFAAAARAAVDALLLLEQGRASFDGQDWSLDGQATDQSGREAALSLASTQLGIDAASAISVPAVEPYIWAANKSSDGAMRFTGMVPSQSLKNFLAVRGGERVRDETTLRDDAPPDFSAEVLKALDILVLLDEGGIAFDGAGWWVTGVSASPQQAELSALLESEADWEVAVSTATPQSAEATPAAEPKTSETEAEPEAPQQPAPAADSAEMAQCRDRLAELSQHNAILFQSGAAIIASGASAELDAFAAALALCPQSAIYVEGHTDSDGDDRQNLALSVARAEAVVNALIERGVAPERLYAVGYGESQPVADNSSAEGKRQNRRIVVSLRDDAN